MSIAENTFNFSGNGSKMSRRYIELIDDFERNDTRTAKEIIDDISNKLNALGGDTDGEFNGFDD